LKGKVTVEMTSEIADGGGKKRKNADIDVVLGPGEQGGEASLASDVQFNDRKKKQKSAAGDDDEDDFHLNGEDADGVAGQGQSIAERLALLSSAIEQSSDDEEDSDGGDKAASKGSARFSAKSATPESLASLLSQALSSADNGKLESAFDVRDKPSSNIPWRRCRPWTAKKDSERNWFPTFLCSLSLESRADPRGPRRSVGGSKQCLSCSSGVARMVKPVWGGWGRRDWMWL